jgi:hypothetical protein
MPVLQENFFVGLSGKNKPFFSKKLRKMKKNEKKLELPKIFP